MSKITKKAYWKETNIVKYKRQLRNLKRSKIKNEKEILRLRKIKDGLKRDFKNLNIIVARMINKFKTLHSYVKEYRVMNDKLNRKIKLLKEFQTEIIEFKQEINKFRFDRQNIKNETKKIKKKLRNAQLKTRKTVNEKFPLGLLKTTSNEDRLSDDLQRISDESKITMGESKYSEASPISIRSSNSNLDDYNPNDRTTSALTLFN